MGAHPRTYSTGTQEALRLLGCQIKLARKQRRMTESELAERVGIARSTLRLIEKGSPKAEIGLVFEAATLIGVPLFEVEPGRVASHLLHLNGILALLPRSIRRSTSEVKDDF